MVLQQSGKCIAESPYKYCYFEIYGDANPRVEIAAIPYKKYDSSTKTLYIIKGSKIKYATVGNKAYFITSSPSCDYYGCGGIEIPQVGEYTFTEDLPNGFAILSLAKTSKDWAYTDYGWLGYNIKIITQKTYPACSIDSFRR